MASEEENINELKTVKQAFKTNIDNTGISTNNVEFRDMPNLITQMEKILPSQTKTVTPTTSVQSITADDGFKLTRVDVNAVEPSDYYKPEVVGRVKSSLSETTYRPSAGNVYREVVVEPILLQSKVVHDNGTIKPDVGYDGLSEVRVNVPKPAPVLIEKNITENGTYISIDDSADGYSVVNVNVESTGGQTSRVDGKYLCRIYDYDGSLVQPDQWLNEGDIFTLPELPTHDGLIAEGWICPAPISNNQIQVTNQDLICSIAYTTESGMTEIDIELTPLTGLDVSLKFNGSKDWGDGTTNSASGHTYTEYGKYTIKCNDTMQTCSSTSRLFGQTSTNPNFSCVAIRFGNTTTPIQSYSLGYCQSLKYCTISSAITTVGVYTFEYCYALTTVSLGQSVATIGNGAFRYCASLTDICIPARVTAVTAQAFQSCFSLSHLSLHQNIKTISTYAFQSTLMRKIAIPNSVQQVTGFVFAACQTIQEVVFPVNFQNIQANAFNGNSSTIKYDFSKVAKVCVLSGTNAFNGINPICKIVVPDSLYYTWIATTNWTTYADYIYKASEV